MDSDFYDYDRIDYDFEPDFQKQMKIKIARKRLRIPSWPPPSHGGMKAILTGYSPIQPSDMCLEDYLKSIKTK